MSDQANQNSAKCVVNAPAAAAQETTQSVSNELGALQRERMFREEVERANQALRDSEERLRLALGVAKLGQWNLDLRTLAMSCSDTCKANYGRRPDDSFTYDDLWRMVHPDDLERVQLAVRRAVETRTDYDTEYRTVWPDGSVHWVLVRGRAEYAADGLPLTMTGVTLDITDRKLTEGRLQATDERYRTLFDEMDEGFVVIEVEFDSTGRATDYRHIEANPAFEKHTGLRGHLGQSVRQTVPGLEEFWFTTYGRVAATGESTRFEHEAEPLGGRWFDVYASRLGKPGDNRVAVFFTDITVRKRAEETIRASEAQNSFLVTLADTLRPLSDPIAVQAEASRVLGERLGANRVVYFEVRGDEYVVERDYATGVPSVIGRHPIVAFGPEQLATYKSGRTAMEADVDAFPFRPSEEKAAFAGVQIRSYIGVPLVKNGVFVAGLAVHSACERAWTAAEIAMTEDTAERTWAAVERVRAEAALRTSEEKFRTLFNSMDEGFCIIEFIDGPLGPLSDYVHIEANPAYSANTGIADIVGQRLRQLVGEEAEEWVEIYRNVLVTGQPVRFERELVATGRHLDLAAFRIEPPERRQVAVLFKDITDRKRAEEVVRQSRTRLDSTLSAGEIGTWEFDVVHNRVWADLNLARMFGVSPQEAEGAPLEAYLKVIHPEDRDQVVETIGRAIEAGDSYEGEYRIAVTGEPVRWVIARGRIDRDGEGRPLRLPGVVMDITGQRLAEAELRKSEDQRRLALDSAELGAWNIDPATNELTSDERFRMIFHGSLAPITYEQAFAAIHPNDRPRVRDGVLAATRPNEPAPYAEEYRVVQPNGTIRWVFARGRANFEQGEPGRKLVSFDGTIADITASKEAEQERERLVLELRDQDKRKDEFLATLAHELRNPLAPIRNGLQILQLGGLTGEVADDVRMMMERQLGHMVHLIDDLLDLSRVSRGKIELRKERVELAKVVRQSVETSRPLIDASGHDLTITMPPGAIYVDADVTRLAQVFSNLLNNAAKYTERGGRIRFSVKRQGGQVVMSVKDNGMGIPAHMLPKVFEMFTQVDRHLERSQGGLGIGLSIVQRLVEMHGGSVGVQSDGPGMGSEFTVQLPVVLSVAQPNGGDEEAAYALRGRKVLVVDDNVDAAKSLAVMLKLMGNEAKTAHDGLEAIEVAATCRPDLILLDIGMPRLNGHETAKRIRQQPWGKDVVLVALTGWGQDEDRHKSNDAGFDAHLVKPIEPATLEKLLSNLRANTA